MVAYDDVELVEKVRVYDRGILLDEQKGDTLYHTLIGYRSGDMWAPKLDHTEALRVEAEHFLECVGHGTRPQSDGAAGLRVVQILEAATRSMVERGRPVDLGGGPEAKTG
jgi:predicted dehydrogenase